MANVPLSTRFIGISENVNLTERKSAVLNAETQPYTIADLVSTIGTGAQGPQGVQGPAGPLGPVGPAGLTWRGAWVSGTSYVANDAVAYNGASWFCILATSGTTTPNLATANWALLASQGAQGIQGVQGPTGPQGAGATQTLQQTVNLGNTITSGVLTSTLSASQFKIGQTATSGLTLNNSQVISKKTLGDFILSFPSSISQSEVATLQSASGTVAYLEDFALTNNTTSALSLATLNSQYPNTFYYVGFRVFCPNITGGALVYSKTGASTWASQSMTNVV